MLKTFFQKSVLFFLVSVLFSLPCFSEKNYTITESELTEIQEETALLMSSVETLTESVRKAETQLNDCRALSNRLRTENEALQAKVKNYRLVTIGVCSGVLVGGVTYYILNK